ncbi:SGNH/GDSL hydrolase family protein [Bacillus sp. NTK071]|uniref:SGNH/GDSL hydrolase family protein n=1 Tax=Bacillus sp. NTK071 TaxID=2802175 RepID=UPI001A8DC862|nr:SGNH/GDSL hydrolase family protein [Bacillus sp. NTK071]MBN8207575.1 SGNH/GDSL hydrolase family protein [Bacillus sp. NTK071]
MKKQRAWLFLFLILAGSILLSIKPVMEYRSQRLNEIKQAASMMVMNKAPNETVISSIADKKDSASTTITPEVTSQQVEEVSTTTKDEVPKNPDLTMVGLGDSLTKGSGDSTGQGYIGRLAANIENEAGTSVLVENFAVHGRRTPKLYKMLKEENVEEALADADVIVMSIGGNDLMKVVKEHFLDLQMDDFQKEQTSYVERLNQIMNKIRSINSKAPILFIGLYNPLLENFQSVTEIDQIVQRWNGATQETVEKDDNTTFVPIYELFHSVDENLFFEDGFHPNDQGYELMARQIQYRLQQDDLVEDIPFE